MQVRINDVLWVRPWLGQASKSSRDYENALGDGIGLGYGQSYQPWLRAQDVRSHGNRSIVFGLKTFRNNHFFSSVESNLFFLAEFNDSVIDIREQFHSYLYCSPNR
jgi:hypothetical protein